MRLAEEIRERALREGRRAKDEDDPSRHNRDDLHWKEPDLTLLEDKLGESPEFFGRGVRSTLAALAEALNIKGRRAARARR
jgi:hypothetical protein